MATALIFGLMTAIATVAGGVLALRFRSALSLLFGFSSGAIIGVALLDLLPEAVQLGGAALSVLAITTATACGLVGYLLLDRFTVLVGRVGSGVRRHLGPGSLTAHSFMDGLGIGLAFQVSSGTGLIVAVAVLAHDVLDGANTVALSFAGGMEARVARRWLAADALAPLAGIVAAGALTPPKNLLAILLAVFAGGFLYIGVSGLLPRSHEDGNGFARVWSTALGFGLIYVIMTLIR